MLTDVDLGLVVLYRELTPDIDPTQLGDDAQAEVFAETGVEEALTNLTASLDLDTRRDRYAANLAYVLTLRLFDATGANEAELAALGALIVSRFPDVGDPVASEIELRDAVGRLLAFHEVTQDVVDKFKAAFVGAYDAVPVPGGWNCTGAAAETAAMLSELVTMEFVSTARPGTVEVSGQPLDVLYLEFDMCTSATWDRCRGGIDPRNWPTYNPSFFQSVDVISGTPASSGNWTGTIQEKVGPLFSGTPLTTNLLVSYIEQPGLVVTAYDLAGHNTTLPPDDGKVTVDYGFVALTDEGVHRKMRVLKVVRIEGMVLPPKWLWPLWTQQMVMAGWWF